jgi:choline transport protein
MKGWIGYAVSIIACVYMAVFTGFYCFPYTMPVDAEGMNYASLVTGGLSIFVGIWWFIRQKNYVGPMVIVNALALEMVDDHARGGLK